MGAVSREAPTVVEGPDHRLSGCLEISEQLLHVQIKPVDIVEMNDIRVVFLYLLYQSARLLLRSKAVFSPKKGTEHMKPHVQICAELISRHALRPGPAAKGHHSLVTLGFQGMYNVHRNPPHASAAADGIDL